MKNYTIRKIITPAIFPIKNSTATAWSERLSSVFKAQLLIYGAIRANNNIDMALYGKKNNDLIKSAMAQLKQLGSHLPGAYSIKYLLDSGKHWRNLVKQMRYEHTDLLVVEMPAKGIATPGRLAALMYSSPCPALFVREDMPPVIPKKILVPVRIKEGLDQKIPAVIAWAQRYGSVVHLSAFISNTNSVKEQISLYSLIEKMANNLRQAGVAVETESVNGFHFGTTIVHRAKQVGADIIAIGVEPANYISRLFTKMIGPYFLEKSSIPVLAIPLIKPANMLPSPALSVRTSDFAPSHT